MRHDNIQSENLFSRLISYTPREGRTALEDFCTESLAWSLQRSEKLRKAFLDLIRSRLTTSKKSPFPERFNVKNLEISTQVTYGKRAEGRFDLLILSPVDDFAIVIEAKVNSDFGHDQIPSYQRELAINDSFPKNRFLVSLTRWASGVSGDVSKILDASVSWSDVQGLFQEFANIHADEYCFMFKHFAEFLKSKGMHFMKIPKITGDQSFNDGILFCHAILNILQEVSNLEDLPGNLNKTVRLKEYDQNRGLWVEFGNKKLYVGFNLRPANQTDKRLCVETSNECVKTLPTIENLKIEKWDGGFSIYGDFKPVMNGNADMIRAWYQQAIKLIIFK